MRLLNRCVAPAPTSMPGHRPLRPITCSVGAILPGVPRVVSVQYFSVFEIVLRLTSADTAKPDRPSESAVSTGFGAINTPSSDERLRNWELSPTGVPAAAAWLRGPPGRARQLNAGAHGALGRWLWFLHADTLLPPDALPTLRERLASGAPALWYFDLRFRDDGPVLMRLTAAGTLLRSRLLGLPFGDQGLALARDAFDALGGFPESAAYGEDHLLVWAARRGGLPVRSVGRPIYTSARKYRRGGWLRTTATHLWLTARQAIPEGLRWLTRP